MRLNDLTEDEIEEVFRRILKKVETNDDVVEKSLKYCFIYKDNGRYCMDFYNGFEHKLCSISDRSVYVSSESDKENRILTAYLKDIIQEVVENKHNQII
ncbi:MAG: hypothetical protein IJ415_04025 [Clostridia bacterium]|nr:hypothetical protein [Clostridia bacterium]